MNSRSLHLLPLVLMFARPDMGVHAQSTGQLLDTTVSSGFEVLTRSGSIAADGGIVLDLNWDGGRHLWKCDQAGVPQWSYHYPCPNIYADNGPLLACANGDLVFATVEDLVFTDSLRSVVMLSRVAGGGAVIWQKRITTVRESSGMTMNMLSGRGIWLGETSDQQIMLGVFLETAPLQRFELTKLDAGGQWQWTKEFVRSSVGNAVGIVPQMIDHAFTTDLDGGCTFTFDMEASGSSVLTARVDGNGAVSWATQVSYLLQANAHSLMDMMVDSDNNIIVTSNVTSQYSDLLRVYLSPTGTFLRTDGYWGGGNASYMVTKRDGTGSLIMANDKVALLAADGSVLQSLQLINGQSTLGQLDYAPRDIDRRGDLILLPGNQRFIPNDPAPSTWRPGFWRGQLTDPQLCGSTATPFTHVAIPNANFNATAITDLTSRDLHTTVTDGPGQYSAVDLMNTQDMCLLTGVGEQPSSDRFMVVNTIVAAGTPLRVRAEEAMTLTITDGAGRVVRTGIRTNVSGPSEVPMTGVVAGPYVVIAQDQQGQRVAAARFVVVN